MRKLLAYGVWDTTCTSILHPKIMGQPAPGYPGLDDGSVMQGHQVGARESAVARVAVSLRPGD